MSDAPPPVVGIFVGGRGARMGHPDKVLIRLPDGRRIADRLVVTARDALGDAPVLLVGRTAPYADLDVPVLADDPPGVGPLGGLVALLRRAANDGRRAIALGGDMPFCTAPLLTRLASEAPEADAVAPRPDGIWQPLFARYRAPTCLAVAEALVAQGRRALRGVLEDLGDRAHVLSLDAAELTSLRDWDTPDDVRRDGGHL